MIHTITFRIDWALILFEVESHEKGSNFLSILLKNYYLSSVWRFTFLYNNDSTNLCLFILLLIRGHTVFRVSFMFSKKYSGVRTLC